MAVETNNSEEQILGKVELFTGLASLPVIMINPDKATLEAAGYKPKEEPVYTGITFKQKEADGITEKDVTRNKIVFYLKGKEMAKYPDGSVKEVVISVRKEILVSPDFDIASTGTLRFINENGNVTYSKDLATLQGNPKMEWFKPQTARQAYVGEAELIDFVINWMNVKPSTKCSLDTIQAIMQGNVKELNDLLKAQPNNRITQLIGVTNKDNKFYQAVYSKCTSRPTASNIAAKFHQKLSESHGEFKADFQNSYELKPFEAKINPAQPDKEADTSATSAVADF